MAEEYNIRATRDRARILAGLIDSAADSQAMGEARVVPKGGTRPVVVEIRQDVAADDFTQFDAWILKHDGTNWVDAGLAAIRVRKISAAAITASEESPVRVLARTVGHFGWCVEVKPAGGGLTIRFRIVASYFCGECYVDARVISTPYGVGVGDLPDVASGSYGNNDVRIYDRAGCYFNEPPEDLVNRIGYATYMDPLEDGPCPDTVFPAWECVSLCCPETRCS